MWTNDGHMLHLSWTDVDSYLLFFLKLRISSLVLLTLSSRLFCVHDSTKLSSLLEMFVIEFFPRCGVLVMEERTQGAEHKIAGARVLSSRVTTNPDCLGSISEKVQYPVAEWVTQARTFKISSHFHYRDCAEWSSWSLKMSWSCYPQCLWKLSLGNEDGILYESVSSECKQVRLAGMFFWCSREPNVQNMFWYLINFNVSLMKKKSLPQTVQDHTCVCEPPTNTNTLQLWSWLSFSHLDLISLSVNTGYLHINITEWLVL